ncbi:LemA family protein [Xylophilus rhododendri]|uniref:LemA family protein n=1 Tax=Xylophilus rhododendri TaxID=2697032 RepID=A0A857J4B6_9BURK|nr:LemA family protein [Xylophilus rhododendri]QHI98626.1 LemA family protein [Xylophilus rhododendri]
MRWSLWWWVVPAVLAFWAVGAHNRLTRLRAAVLQAFGQLDAAMALWIELVPPAPDPATPLDEAAAADEAGWAGLRAAALQLGACLAVARQRRQRRQRRADIAALSAARDVLRDAWQRLLLETPRFGGQAQPGSIHLVWEQRDTQVQLAIDQYNQAVRLYNAALGQFPAAILAWLLRLRRAQVL